LAVSPSIIVLFPVPGPPIITTISLFTICK
jgi:hypothetical protein